MFQLFRNLRTIFRHPLCGRKLPALLRFVRWQLGSRLLRAPVAVPLTDRTRLLVSTGMTGATGNIYCGLFEFEDMAFVLHFLRADDLFVDIGANIGVYTILASGQNGARSISIEPVPATFAHMETNVLLNRLEQQVRRLHCGVGKSVETLKFTMDGDAYNHVLSDEDASTTRYVEVEVRPLDDLVAGEHPICIKIDVEGFEANVLAGGQKTFADPQLQAVLLELNGSGERYGFLDHDIDQSMRDFGFTSFAYEPFKRKLQPRHYQEGYNGNLLYLRDPEWIQQRLTDANPIRLPWRTIE